MTQRYDTYKDSGVQWLGEIPGHWECCKIGHLFFHNTGKALASATNKGTPHQYITTSNLYWGYFDLSNIKEMLFEDSELSRYTIQKGDLLVCEGGDVGRAAIWNYDFPLCIQNHVHRLRPAKDILPQYYYYYFFVAKTREGINSKGIGIQGFSSKAIHDLKTLLPPLPEQHAIVSYLDDKCSKIDEWIEKKQKEVELLGEMKQRVIADAVTRGLNPDVKMKQTNISWLPEVPEHWEILKFRCLFSIKKNIAGQLGYNVISVTQQGLRIKDVDSNKGQIASDYSKYQIVEPGDFAMNHMDLLTGYIGLSEYCGVTSPDYRVFRRKSATTCNEYFLKIFELCYKLKIFYGLGQGVANVGRWRLPAKNLLNFELPVPPIEEQKQIVLYVNERTAKIDKLVENVNKEIEALKEYKQRLISDVVTGQIKVC